MAMRAKSYRNYDGLSLSSASSSSNHSASVPSSMDITFLLNSYHHTTTIDIKSPVTNAENRISSILTEQDIDNEARLWEEQLNSDCPLIGTIDECYGGSIKGFKELAQRLYRVRRRASARVCRALSNIPVGYQLPPTGPLEDQILRAIRKAQKTHDLCIRYTKRVLRYNAKFPNGPAPSVLHIRDRKYLEPHERQSCAAADCGAEESEGGEPEEGFESDNEEGSGGEEEHISAPIDQGRQVPPSHRARTGPAAARPYDPYEGSSQPRSRYVVRAILKHKLQSPEPSASRNVEPSFQSKRLPVAPEFSETILETPSEEVSFPLPCPGKKCSTILTSMEHATSHWIAHPLGQFRCHKCKNRIIKYPEAVKRHYASVHKLDGDNPEVIEQIELGRQRLTKLWRNAVGLSVTEDYEVIEWGPDHSL